MIPTRTTVQPANPRRKETKTQAAVSPWKSQADSGKTLKVTPPCAHGHVRPFQARLPNSRVSTLTEVRISRLDRVLFLI